MAIAGMVVGICSIPFAFWACYGPTTWMPILLVIAGIVLSAIGMMKAPERKGLALAGLVCSIVGLIVTIIVIIASCACAARYVDAAGLLLQAAGN